MNKIMHEKMLDYHQREAERLNAIKINCDSCVHWKPCSRVDRGCELADATPPPEVQAVGCDEWAHDPVPF